MLTTEATLRLSPQQLHYNLGCLLQQTDPEQAAIHYRQAILLSRQTSDGEIAAAHHNLGVILAQQERWLAAIYHYRRAIALQPHCALFFCNLGTALLRRGEAAAAIQVYQQAAGLSAQLPANLSADLSEQEQAPIEANLYHCLGQAFQTQRRLGDAIAAYRRSLAIDPDKAEVYYNLGRAFYQQGNLQQAIACFEQALSRDPDLTVAWGDCAYAQLTLGQFDRAMQSFRQAIAPQQNFVTAFCTWIQSLSMAKPVAEADQIATDQTDEFMQARLASAQFLTALTKGEPDPKSAIAQTMIRWANVLTEYGGNAQLRYAERLYQHSLHLMPQQIDLYERLTHCLIRQQRLEAAIATYHLAQAIAPENGEIAAKLKRLEQQIKQQIQQTDTALPDAVPACEGLNCQPCLQQLTRWFEPVQISQGVYRLTQRSVHAAAVGKSQRALEGIGDTSPDRPPAVIQNGRVWVTPQRRVWQSCRAVAVFSAQGERVPHLSRSYPGQLPICQAAAHSLNSLPEPLPESLPEPLTVKGKVAVLSSLSGNIYFHWMTDLLPRLEMLSRQINLQEIDYFLVNGYQRSFQQETLEAFGIQPDRILTSDSHPHLQAEQLIVPEFAGPLGWMQSWAVQCLRDRFLSCQSFGLRNFDRLNHSDSDPTDSYLSYSSDTPRFIYLSRSDASYRRLLNEDAVMDYLQPYGFVSLTLDRLSVAQQATLFANARIIVAPHGSSLTNLVFCQPGTTVIELTSPHYLRHYFWRISRLLKLQHDVILGDVFSCHFLRQLMYPNPLLEDIWIDIDRLHQTLQQTMQQTMQQVLKQTERQADSPFPA